jgi:hypothetical protein
MTTPDSQSRTLREAIARQQEAQNAAREMSQDIARERASREQDSERTTEL